MKQLIHRIIIRPWHVTVPIVTTAIVTSFAYAVPHLSTNILATSSAVMQAVGMCTLVLILNKNMSTLQGKTIVDDIKSYLREVSNKPKSAHLTIDSFKLSISVGNARARVSNQGITEERLRAIEGELESLFSELDGSTTKLKSMIEASKEEAEAKLQAVNSLISTLDNKLQGAVIGDYRGQIFSIVMIIIGLVLSVPFLQSAFKP